MAVGLKNSSGTDFDSLLHQGTGNQLFYIYTNAGTDVGQRYLPASSGIAAANCNFKNSSAQDIGPKLCKINNVTPAYTSQTLSGSGTFTVPSGVKKLKITVKGGGGGGGGSCKISTTYAAGGAGGKSGYTQTTISTSPGSTFQYSVGGAGAGGSGKNVSTGSMPSVLTPHNQYHTLTANSGGSGGSSTFGSYTSSGGGGGGGSSCQGMVQESYDKDENVSYSYYARNATAGSAGTSYHNSGSSGGGGGNNGGAGGNGSGGSIVVEYGVGIQ